MSSYKLEIMAEKFGIELDDAHDADADVTARPMWLWYVPKGCVMLPA